MEEANQFLSKEYIKEFNRRFTVESGLEGTAFVPCQRIDLERVFSIQTERVVNRDNTVRFENLILQIDRQNWRATLSGCRVMLYKHLDNTISIGFGAHTVGRYTSDGEALQTNLIKNKASFEKSYAKQQTGHLMC